MGKGFGIYREVANPGGCSTKFRRMRKCRCDKALVVDIQNVDGTKADIDTVCSDYDENFVYAVGATVEVSDFDDDRWNEYAPRIHLFIDRRAAVEY